MQKFTVVEVGILNVAMQTLLRHRDPEQADPVEEELAERIARLYGDHLAGPVDAVALIEVELAQ